MKVDEEHESMVSIELRRSHGAMATSSLASDWSVPTSAKAMAFHPCRGLNK